MPEVQVVILVNLLHVVEERTRWIVQSVHVSTKENAQ